MTDKPEGFSFKKIHRNVSGSWPSATKDYDGWLSDLKFYKAVEDWDRAKLQVVADVLKSMGLPEYAEEVYWTALAYRMKLTEDRNRADE